MIAEQTVAAAGRYIYAIVQDGTSRRSRPAAASAPASEPAGFDGRPVMRSRRGESPRWSATCPIGAPPRAQEPGDALRGPQAPHVAERGAADGVRDDRRQRGVHPADSPRHQEAVLEQFNRVEGKFEMGLRVSWNVPNIFEHFMSTHEELAGAARPALPPWRRPLAAGEDRTRPTVRPDAQRRTRRAYARASSPRCGRRVSRSRRIRPATSAK